MSNGNHSNGLHGSYYQHSNRKQVEAILVLCAEFNSIDMKELYEGSIPIVMIDFLSETACNITSNNKTGIFQAVKYLVDRNHTRIASIHGDPDTYIGGLRRQYFLDAMAENGLEVPEEFIGDGKFYSRENGFDAMNEIMKATNQPTAVVCASDMLAIGAIQAIHKKGLKVPDDYSIIGFDGIDAGQLISPKLTTVLQDTEQIGKMAAKNILKMIKNKKQMKKGQTIMVETSILEGESTRTL